MKTIKNTSVSGKILQFHIEHHDVGNELNEDNFNIMKTLKNLQSIFINNKCTECGLLNGGKLMLKNNLQNKKKRFLL